MHYNYIVIKNTRINKRFDKTCRGKFNQANLSNCAMADLPSLYGVIIDLID